VFKSLEYVTSYIYAHPPNYTSFYGASQPAPFEDEPDKLFDRVFGDFDPQDSPAAAALRADRQSVLHSVYAEYKALDARLGKADRERLAAHLDQVKDLEQKVLAQANAACTVPAKPAANDSDAGLDVLVHDLACDPQAAAAVDQVKTYQAGLVKNLVDKLAAIPEGSGTLFDNTLVVWADEFCHGYAHAHNEVPYVLLCGSDRFFEMGRYLHYQQAVSNNRLWNSLIAAMDADGAGDFGDPQFDNTPLPELA
jgi:hypothetical protein